MITLSPRLAAVAGYVLPGGPLADIGTDHAYLPAHLVGTGAIPKAIAGDILPGPLEAARSTVAEAGLTDRIELRLGSGLKVLTPGEVITASICGMGGPLIAEILTAGPLEGIQRLVLQPMGGEERLREWLSRNGWRLVAEQLVADAGRVYIVMAAERGAMTLTEAELMVGPHLRAAGGPLLVRYAQVQMTQARRALEGARRSGRDEARGRVAELEHRMALLEEVIRDAEGDRRADR